MTLPRSAFCAAPWVGHGRPVCLVDLPTRCRDEGVGVSELPSGTVTFLFTDLEGSTRLWQEYPDAMRAVLARHDRLVRDAIEAHGGYVVKDTGDGAHAAFATASDAVDAAVAGPTRDRR